MSLDDWNFLYFMLVLISVFLWEKNASIPHYKLTIKSVYTYIPNFSIQFIYMIGSNKINIIILLNNFLKNITFLGIFQIK